MKGQKHTLEVCLLCYTGLSIKPTVSTVRHFGKARSCHDLVSFGQMGQQVPQGMEKMCHTEKLFLEEEGVLNSSGHGKHQTGQMLLARPLARLLAARALSKLTLSTTPFHMHSIPRSDRRSIVVAANGSVSSTDILHVSVYRWLWACTRAALHIEKGVSFQTPNMLTPACTYST